MPGMKNKLISSAVAAVAVAVAFSAGALVNARTSSHKQQDVATSQHASSRANALPFTVPDLADRVAKFKVVRMPFHAKGLSKKEIEMVEKLVDAAGLADCIYWRQSDPDGLKLYLALAHDNSPNALLLRRYLKINGSRFDLIDDQKPFTGVDPMPLGRGFYPAGLTVDEMNAYVAAHPDQKAALLNPLTVIRKNGDALEVVPYHVAYQKFLEPMAKDLNDAADLSDDPAFAKYLKLRAGALLNDDYYQSDLAWLDLDNPEFDLILAPYETYDDTLMGVKATYGASVMIRNDVESAKLAIYQKYVPELQDSLPLAPEDLPTKRGKQSPAEVVDSPYRAGDLLHGYQAVADNLPNDPRVHVEKGSKKIFWKNFMDARVNVIILPVAQRLMRPDQAAMASGDGYLADTLMHEISHGLGPVYSRTAAGKVDVREAIGASYSALEESKADVVGEMGYDWLVKHGVVPKERQNGVYASYVAGIFRTVRFGVAEAHGHGEIMQFNYLVERGAITRDSSTGLYVIDFAKMPDAIASLAKELLEQEATGDKARVDAWFTKYGNMPPELAAALAKTNDIPVDVDPQFDFHPPLY
jgi:hypothetical protein